jgi:hypothetical protein
MSGRAMGSHQSAAAKTTTWITPEPIIKALGGWQSFNLDPCIADAMPWRTAVMGYTETIDGLSQEWSGRVWLNPPYGNEAGEWIHRLADHGNGIALVSARTETEWFEGIWRATAVLFKKGRIYFHHTDGTRGKTNAGAPSVFAAYGMEDAMILKESGINGKFLFL